MTLRTLSGGNQQKAILGRELSHGAPVLIVEQPTRGVDVGAIENIHASSPPTATPDTACCSCPRN